MRILTVHADIFNTNYATLPNHRQRVIPAEDETAMITTRASVTEKKEL